MYNLQRENDYQHVESGNNGTNSKVTTRNVSALPSRVGSVSTFEEPDLEASDVEVLTDRSKSVSRAARAEVRSTRKPQTSDTSLAVSRGRHAKAVEELSDSSAAPAREVEQESGEKPSNSSDNSLGSSDESSKDPQRRM